MGKKNGSGAGAYVALAVSALFVAGCALAFWLIATGRLKASGRQAEPAATAADPAGTGVPASKAFSEYSWDELSQIARMISAAADDAAGVEVAREYGIVGADGAIARSSSPTATSSRAASSARARTSWRTGRARRASPS